MEVLSQTTVFDGQQTRLTHRSDCTDSTMTLSVYMPPCDRPVPALLWLSGLTCSDENFLQKAGAQRVAAELGIALVAPDTSPRGLNLPGEEDGWDFGTGAGFYVNATQAPWSSHYRMFDYVTREVPALVQQHFAVDGGWSVSGHSMGGHGALVAALRTGQQFASASAFAPIAQPTQCPWGEKAFGGYLGDDRETWKRYDTTALLQSASQVMPMLIDQGGADEFLDAQLGYPALVAAAAAHSGRVHVNLREGYDHSYYFIASFMEAHLRFHHAALVAV
ncbi:MAG: S-formylglutathione hydrolase [Gammaproteobacteria bacterium]